jgi:hypothetical protein
MDTDSTRQDAPSLNGQTAPEVMQGDLQEYRAYLQRGETRLSTLHRVAGSFISGAGLLTLLPVLGSQTFPALCAGVVFVNYSHFPAAGSPERWLALIPVLVSLALPLVALISLIRDLIAFYFTPYHFDDSSNSVVYPRFILSGIRVSDLSLSADGQTQLREARGLRPYTDLLVPRKRASRERLLQEATAIGELKTLDLDTADERWAAEQLQDFVHRYTASHVRTLAQESAKMEASLARHHMFLRILVLRYAKAFLLTILTTVFTVMALSIINVARSDVQQQLAGPGNSLPISGELLWVTLLGTYGVWCFLAAYFVRRPVFWIYRDTDNTRSPRTPVSLAKFERQTLLSVAGTSVVVSALLGWYLAFSDSIGTRWVAGLLIVLCLGSTLPLCLSALRSEHRPLVSVGGYRD